MAVDIAPRMYCGLVDDFAIGNKIGSPLDASLTLNRHLVASVLFGDPMIMNDGHLSRHFARVDRVVTGVTVVFTGAAAGGLLLDGLPGVAIGAGVLVGGPMATVRWTRKHLLWRVGSPKPAGWIQQATGPASTSWFALRPASRPSSRAACLPSLAD